MRVALYGEFATGNLGNDASLLAAVDALRSHHPDAHIVCLCNAPELAAQQFGIPAIAVRRHVMKMRTRLRKPVRRLARRLLIVFQLCTTDLVRMYLIMRKFDAVIVPGMGVMEAGWMKPGSFAAPLLMTTAAARLACVEVVLVSIGAGAAHRRSTRTLLRWTLRLSTYRSFRDTHSRSAADGFGVRCLSDNVYPDLVFGRDPLPELANRTQQKAVGIGLIKYRAAFSDDEPTLRDAIAAEYHRVITAFVDWLLDQNFEVVLLTGDQKDDETANLVYENISQHRSTKSVQIARSTSFDDLLKSMLEVDYVIGSRYHNIVAAVLATKPVVSINYMHKNAELMNHVGLDAFHQPIEQLDGELLRTQFRNLERTATEISERLIAKRDAYKHLVDDQWSVLARTLIRSRTRPAVPAGETRATAR